MTKPISRQPFPLFNRSPTGNLNGFGEKRTFRVPMLHPRAQGSEHGSRKSVVQFLIHVYVRDVSKLTLAVFIGDHSGLLEGAPCVSHRSPTHVQRQQVAQTIFSLAIGIVSPNLVRIMRTKDWMLLSRVTMCPLPVLASVTTTAGQLKLRKASKEANR